MTKINYLFLAALLELTGCTVPAEQSLEFRKEHGKILLYSAQRHIFSYQVSTNSLNGKYPRSNYIHPLNDFQGNPLTEDFPADHPHHRGIFWAWHQLYVNNVSLADLWECSQVTWKVGGITKKITNKQANLQASVDWLIGKEQLNVLTEDVTIIYKEASNYYTLDFDINLHPQVDELAVGGSEDEKGYGGFSARLKLGDNPAFFDVAGEVVPKNTQIQGGNWIKFAGIGTQNNDVVIMYHPQSSAQLQGWILRKHGSMQNPVWPGRNPAVLFKGEPMIMRVRIVVFEKRSDNQKIQDIYQDYLQN